MKNMKYIVQKDYEINLNTILFLLLIYFNLYYLFYIASYIFLTNMWKAKKHPLLKYNEIT